MVPACRISAKSAFLLAFPTRMHHLNYMNPSQITRALLALLFAICGGTVRADQSRVSFRNDIMPLLSKAGCNTGGCHGNANGKAGFKLSLRGESPDIDFLTLTRDAL